MFPPKTFKFLALICNTLYNMTPPPQISSLLKSTQFGLCLNFTITPCWTLTLPPFSEHTSCVLSWNTVTLLGKYFHCLHTASACSRLPDLHQRRSLTLPSNSIHNPIDNPFYFLHTFIVTNHYLKVLEKEMATHSSILTWRIPWTEEPSGSPRGRKELDMTEQLHTLTHTSKSVLLIFVFILYLH